MAFQVVGRRGRPARQRRRRNDNGRTRRTTRTWASYTGGRSTTTTAERGERRGPPTRGVVLSAAGFAALWKRRSPGGGLALQVGRTYEVARTISFFGERGGVRRPASASENGTFTSLARPTNPFPDAARGVLGPVVAESCAVGSGSLSSSWGCAAETCLGGRSEAGLHRLGGGTASPIKETQRRVFKKSTRNTAPCRRVPFSRNTASCRGVPSRHAWSRRAGEDHDAEEEASPRGRNATRQRITGPRRYPTPVDSARARA